MNLVKHKKTLGFSLIEALIAALIVGVGMLGLAKLQGEMFIGSSESRMQTHAQNAAQAVIENFRSFSHQSTYEGFADGNDVFTPVGSNAEFNRSWVVTPCPNTVNCKQIQVTVTWTDSRNNLQTINLSSYISEADPVKSGVVLAEMTVPSPPTPPGEEPPIEEPPIEEPPIEEPPIEEPPIEEPPIEEPPIEEPPVIEPPPGGGSVFQGGDASQPQTTWSTTGAHPRAINWPSIPGATEYKIYDCQTGNQSAVSCVPTSTTTTQSTTSYTPTDPDNQRTRCVRVVATDGVNESSASITMCVRRHGQTYTYTTP